MKKLTHTSLLDTVREVSIENELIVIILILLEYGIEKKAFTANNSEEDIASKILNKLILFSFFEQLFSNRHP